MNAKEGLSNQIQIAIPEGLGVKLAILQFLFEIIHRKVGPVALNYFFHHLFSSILPLSFPPHSLGYAQFSFSAIPSLPGSLESR